MIRKLTLKEGQTFLLSPPSETLQCVSLVFLSGIARISVSYGNTFSDITLGFCGDSEKSWINLPDDSNLLLEAMTESSLEVDYQKNCPIKHDLMWQWLFDLHLVRHPVGSEARLISLLQLLVSRFGIRRSDGYFLPFALGHSRIAELIGATRSTVTRQLTLLRHQRDLTLNKPHGFFVLSARLIETPLGKKYL